MNTETRLLQWLIDRLQRQLYHKCMFDEEWRILRWDFLGAVATSWREKNIFLNHFFVSLLETGNLTAVLTGLGTWEKYNITSIPSTQFPLNSVPTIVSMFKFRLSSRNGRRPSRSSWIYRQRCRSRCVVGTAGDCWTEIKWYAQTIVLWFCKKVSHLIFAHC